VENTLKVGSQVMHRTAKRNIMFLLSFMLMSSLGNRVLLGKLIVAQVVKKFLELLWNQRIHYYVRKNSPLVPIIG